MFDNIYENKTVVITGHTGFKGTWLSAWLLKLGAKVIGVSDCIPTKPSMFKVIGIEDEVIHHLCDIRDFERLNKIIEEAKPDFLFHLAAQPIVSISYSSPLSTISTNVMGTANVLESLRNLTNECTAIIITSDKCYENVEWEWGYKETDQVGGKDIYSGSKGAAEIIFHSYQQSFFNKPNSNIRLASGRAGNVIGGGDWATDRIVVDCMRSWAKGSSVEIRSPMSTRPWQHVLEPLSGYLTLAQKLSKDMRLHGQSFNFGPKAEPSRSVVDLLSDLSEKWTFGEGEAYVITDNIYFHEAGLLKLNCDKALYHLDWEANLYYRECVELVGDWYFSFYNKKINMKEFTYKQIEKYEKIAFERGLVWSGK